MNGGTIKFVGLSNRRTVELSDYRTIGLSNRRTIEQSDYRSDPYEFVTRRKLFHITLYPKAKLSLYNCVLYLTSSHYYFY